MLFDPKWENPLLSLDNLISWLRTKRGAYVYVDSDGCMLAQYFVSMGEPLKGVTNSTVYTRAGAVFALPKGWANIAGRDFTEWTFEKALERAIAFRNSNMLAAELTFV